MPTYLYTTRTSAVPQEVLADNLPAAIRLLQSRLVVLAGIGEPPPDAAGDAAIPEAELCILLRQLAAMLDNGTPMVDALRLLAGESRNQGVRRAVGSLADEVAEGIPLSAGMGARPRAFGPMIAALVRAGEASGALAETLRQTADQREGFARTARQTTMMLVYPAAVSVWAFAVVTFVLTYIIPKWLQLYKELGVQDFPLTTRVLIAASHGFPWFVLALVASAGTAIGLYVARRRVANGRVIVDYWRLGAPVVGRINLNLALGRVAGALGLLLSRGVPVLEALRLAGHTAGNAVIAGALRRAERAVAEGRPLAEGLREAEVLPESFTWHAAAGERSGDMAEAFRRMGTFYVEVSHAAARAAQGVLEPLIVIAMGLLVLFIVLGIFLPLVGIVSSLSGS